jgi:polysaccharide biosynthesis transport protein
VDKFGALGAASKIPRGVWGEVLADFTGERSTFMDDVGVSAQRRPATRRKPKASLVRARILRGVKRQLPTFIMLVALSGGVGLLYAYADKTLLSAAWPATLGVSVGLALAISATLEFSRNTITSIASLGKHRGYVVLGAAPDLTAADLRELPPDWRSPLGCLAFHPASAFAGAFRDLQGAIADDHVVSVIAPIPNDGASTVALGAAVSAMQQGRRVVIVDCDVRRRSLTRTFACNPEQGVLEAAERPQNWRAAIDHEHETGLAFIPAAEMDNPWRGLIGAPGLSALIQELRRAYDLVILDCPPALANAEGRALASLADKCVVVAAWDDTTLGAIRSSIAALKIRANANTALFINRVPANYRFGRLGRD